MMRRISAVVKKQTDFHEIRRRWEKDHSKIGPESVLFQAQGLMKVLFEL
jgi:hypothetical protein